VQRDGEGLHQPAIGSAGLSHQGVEVWKNRLSQEASTRVYGLEVIEVKLPRKARSKGEISLDAIY
jgi:hypothetical protein